MIQERPNVGIGIVIVNNEGKVLVGKRKGSHAQHYYSIPGGHLELGETFEEAAICSKHHNYILLPHTYNTLSNII